MIKPVPGLPREKILMTIFDANGRALTVPPEAYPPWIIKEVFDADPALEGDGLRVGDYCLYAQDKNKPTTYKAAESVSDLVALRRADQDHRRLMIWSWKAGRWIPVLA